MDVFGSDPAAALATAEVAWEFLNSSVYGDSEIERPTAPPQILPRQFKQDYRRHLQNVVSDRAGVTA